MKKLSVIIMALALVMGFTQCKKDNLNDNANSSANGLPVLEGQTFNISLGLGTSSNAKASVGFIGGGCRDVPWRVSEYKLGW